ncbi:MAG: hypothetical protein HN341_14535 [Verrucomicrobia bacterium]|jgi:hypothetical protein|nr:hypothetical protein [Verrucomicrobiota bacterium]
MAYALIIGIFVFILLLPAILGAILRLVFRNERAGALSLAIGVLLTILQAGLASDNSGALFIVSSFQEHDFPAGGINAMVVLCIVLQIGFCAAIASLGIKLTDKLRGSQQNGAR